MRRRSFLLSTLATAVAMPAFAVDVIQPADVAERVRRVRGAVLVHAWATWCGPCRSVFDDVNEAAEDYRLRGLSVLAFALDNDVGAVERYESANQTRWVGHHLRGGAGLGQAIEALGGRYAGSIPYDLLLDSRGRVVAQWAGGIGRARLREFIESALPDTPTYAPVAWVDQGRVRIVFAGHDGEPVSIDGWNAGVLPLDTELVGGPHVFRVEGAAGRIEVERSVLLAAGRTVEVDLGTAPSLVPPEG